VRKRLLYVVTEDWYFLSHRLPMARAAAAAGYEVHVATRVDAAGDAIAAEGFRLHALPWRRGGGGAANIAGLIALRRVIRDVSPDITHCVALKPIVFFGLAARVSRQPGAALFAATGLGSAFADRGPRAALARWALRSLLRGIFRNPRDRVLTQNEEDRALLVALALAPAERIALIRGSGVDVDRMPALPSPSAAPPTIAFVGRMIAQKGVDALIAASNMLVARGVDHRLRLVGAPDAGNASAYSEAQLAAMTAPPQIIWRGAETDIGAIWRDAAIAVLPSWREGLPKSLLEAAACARPIVATDVPGCREIVRDGENGFLTPLHDVAALADALERLVRDPDLRARMGAASRRLVESDLSADAVGAATVALYDSLVAAD